MAAISPAPVVELTSKTYHCAKDVTGKNHSPNPVLIYRIIDIEKPQSQVSKVQCQQISELVQMIFGEPED